MRFKTIIAALAVLGIAFVAVIAIMWKSMDFTEFRELVIQQTKEATGRNLVIPGDLILNLSLRPTLTANAVSFSNAPWGSRREMVKLERLEFELHPIPLIFRDVQVKRLVLVSPDILLETDSQGRGNWIFRKGNKPLKTKTASGSSESTHPKDAPISLLHEIRMEKAKLSYRHPFSLKTTDIAIQNFSARAEDLKSPLHLELSAIVNNQPMEITAETGPLNQLASPGTHFPIHLNAKLAEATLKIEGTVRNPLKGSGFDLNIQAQASSLSNLSQWTTMELPPLGPLRITADFSDVDETYSLNKFQASLGRSKLEGTASVKMGTKRPYIQAHFTSLDFNFDEWLKWGNSQKSARFWEFIPGSSGIAFADTGQRIFSNTPFPLEGLNIVDTHVRISNGKISGNGVELKKMDLDLALEEGNLRINPLKGEVEGGTLFADLSLDVRQANPALEAKINLKEINIAPLLKKMKATNLLSSGNVDLEVDLRGNGGSLQTLMESLNGKINMVMGKGEIDNQYLDFEGSDLFKLFAGGGKKEHTDLNCFVCRFRIRNGIAMNEGLLLDTGTITVAGEGSVNLASERVRLTIKARPKEESLLRLTVPVQIRGTLAEPYVLADTENIARGVLGALLGTTTSSSGPQVPFVQKGTDSKNPCVEALAKRSASTPPSPPDERKKEGIEEKLKGFLKAFGG